MAMAETRRERTGAELESKRAIVTDAACGICRAIAERFAEVGAEVLLVDSEEECLATRRQRFRARAVRLLEWSSTSPTRAPDAASFLTGALVPVDGGQTSVVTMGDT